jgi:signal transduction histidine kinase
MMSGFTTLRLTLLPTVVVSVTIALGVLFHVRGQQVTEAQLKERLLNVVSVAALQFDAQMIEEVRDASDVETNNYRSIVTQLRNIRDISPHVRFAYIMRRTGNPLQLAFVADADALSSNDQLDINNDGVVGADEVAASPGELYDIEKIPALQTFAFNVPIVDDAFTIDQWGRFVSAYAPIKDDGGTTVAVLGLDMQADDFFTVAQSTFSILAVVLVGLVGLFLALYIVVIMRMRKLETLSQLDDERSALLDLATHQLGMPMATFRWWLEILRERDNGKFCEKDGVCDQLQEGIDRMGNIIRSLTEAGNLQRKNFTYKASKVNIAQFIAQMVADTKKMYDRRGQTIKLDIAKNLSPISIDRKLFVGVIRELLENASWYSKDKAEVIVQASQSRSRIEISVTDRGCGIPPADLAHIFEKFKRGSNASMQKPVGNGMGLYIAKGIVERAGGRISIRSELNKGTTVTVRLPAA